MRILLLFASLVFVLSCTTKPVTDTGAREPAGAPGTATAEPDEENMTTAQTTDELKTRITQWVRYYIIFGGQAQKIVASFDEKLKEGLASTDENDRERVRTELREIDCQVMELNSLTHEMEDKLRLMYKAVVDRQDAVLADWFIERLAVAPNFDTPAQILARLNYIHIVKTYHDSICNDAVCKKTDFTARRLRFPFNPWSHDEAFAYRQANTKEIALFYANPISTEGSCISRMPQSATPGKNYFGGNLPVGAFAVTYDDGPHKDHTLAILNTWKATNYPKPVFFWLGKEVARYPEIVKTVAKNGNEIACHSYSHPDLGNLFNSRSYDDLNRTNVALFFPGKSRPTEPFNDWRAKHIQQEFYGALKIIETSLAQAQVPQKKVAKFRFPYGSGYNNPGMLKMLADRGLSHLHWKVDSLDYQDKNPVSIIERVKGQMKLAKTGGIILFHDIHPQSAEATKLLIKFIQTQKSFRLAPLDEAL